MMHLPALALVLTILGYSLGNITINTQDGPIKGITKVITGISGNNQKVSVFYGIPYAKPPLDKLRFRNPQPPTPWQNTLDATQKPPSCPQRPASFLNTNTSEDCLYLNVWTPAIKLENSSLTGKRDVIFWIHGGGFTLGGSMIKKHDGSYLATEENVVFVSINYRLGPYGFLNLNSEDFPGNMGLYDTVMALNWVKRNIGAFGGNPDSVTIMGNSAGGAIVSALLLSPVSRDKFKNAVVQSLSMFSTWSHQNKQDSLDNSREFVISVGCITENSSPWNADTYISSDVIDCLQKLDLSAIDSAFDNIFGDYQSQVGLIPVIDGVFFPESPDEMLANGNFKKDASVLIGHTSKEGTLLALGGLSHIFSSHASMKNTTDPQKEEDFVSKEVAGEIIQMMFPMLTDLGIDVIQHIYTDWDTVDGNYLNSMIDFIGDITIVCSNIAFASAASKFTTVYYYEFKHVANINGHLPKWTGAVHGDDIPFFFGNVYNPSFNYDNQDKMVSKTMIKHLSSFASTGNPTSNWPKFNEREQRFISYEFPEIDINGTRPRAQECAFFNELFPKLLPLPGFSKILTINGKRRPTSKGSKFKVLTKLTKHNGISHAKATSLNIQTGIFLASLLLPIVLNRFL